MTESADRGAVERVYWEIICRYAIMHRDEPLWADVTFATLFTGTER
jgi:hypothetical protein